MSCLTSNYYSTLFPSESTSIKMRKLTPLYAPKEQTVHRHCVEEGDKLSCQSHQNDDASTDHEMPISKEPKELQAQEQSVRKYKTELCQYWMKDCKCKYGKKCFYAHGLKELQCRTDLPSNYMTKDCAKFSELGYCYYGIRCQFIHRCLSSDKYSYRCILYVNSSNISLMGEKSANFDMRYVNICKTNPLRVFAVLR